MRRVFKALGLPGFVLLSLSLCPFAAAEVLDKTATINGTTLRYKVVVPNNFDATKAYPAVLAFPPGGQGMDMVQATLNSVYRAQAEQRGYIVVEPAAPNGDLFFEGGERVFPAFLTKLLTDYRIADNKFHGFLDDATPQQISALGKMCIHMFAGELDSGWPEEMRDQAAKFRASGHNVTFVIEKGQPHVIRTLTGAGAARLFDQFDSARQGRCAK